MNYLFTFLEGIASFISPCVLPMLPIYISYFAGKDSKKPKAISNSIAFVLGFSIIFILMAIIANRLGSILIDITRIIKIVFGVIIIILGLNYIEILKLKIFNGKISINKKIDVKNLNFTKSLIFGMLFSISMTPCVGTFLSSALLLIASEKDFLNGIILIVLYCIGLGIPFIISSVLIDKLKNVFTFIKNNYKTVKILSGVVLIVMGIYLILV